MKLSVLTLDVWIGKIKIGHYDSAELLIEHGADVNYKDENDMTPLFFAAVNGHFECMALLIKHGIRQNTEKIMISLVTANIILIRC